MKNSLGEEMTALDILTSTKDDKKTPPTTGKGVTTGKVGGGSGA